MSHQKLNISQSLLKLWSVLLFLFFSAHPTLAIDLASYSLNQEVFSVTMEEGAIHEKCLRLSSGQVLNYFFESNQHLSFNLHYHESGKAFYPIVQGRILTQKQDFKVKKNQSYCLMWQNFGQETATLKYQFQVEEEKMADTASQIPVYFRVSKNKKEIHAVDSLGKEFMRFVLKTTILNFALDHSSSTLAVVTSNLKNSLHIYDIPTQKLKAQRSFPSIPQFLVFSQKDRFLVVADGHSQRITLLKSPDFQTIHEIKIPHSSIALDSPSDQENQFLVRTSTEILKIQFEPLQILERNAKIPVQLGESTLYINPNEYCFAHGAPHPLYQPIDAMSRRGVRGFIPHRNLLP